MWNSGGAAFEQGFAGNDGGFMGTQGQFASPAGQGEKKGQRSKNLFPLTLKNIQNCTSETLMVGNVDVNMLKVVGLIRAVDVTSTKITYTIDDTTAVMEAVQWVDSDQENKDVSKPLMEMTYCQIFGSMRVQQGKKYIMIFRILPVEDLNLITTHILEVIHAVLKLQQVENLQATGVVDGAGSTGQMSNSLVGTSGFDGNTSMGSGGFSGMHGLNGQQNMVFQVVRQCADEAGVNKDVIYQQLQGRLNHMVINQVLEFLSSEGHIYTTIDDDHFKATDS